MQQCVTFQQTATVSLPAKLRGVFQCLCVFTSPLLIRVWPRLHPLTREGETSCAWAHPWRHGQSSPPGLPFVPLSPLCTQSSVDRPRWDGTVLTGKRFFFYCTSHSLERLKRWFSASSATVSTSWRQFWRAWSVASCPGTILIKTCDREGIRQLIDPQPTLVPFSSLMGAYERNFPGERPHFNQATHFSWHSTDSGRTECFFFTPFRRSGSSSEEYG